MLTNEDKELLKLFDESIDPAILSNVMEFSFNTDVNLEEYIQDANKKLEASEDTAIQTYLSQTQNVRDVRRQIKECDRSLEKIEIFLTGFLTNIDNLSEEVTNLQAQSQAIQILTKRCQNVSSKLNPIINELMVPQELIKKLFEVPLTDCEFKQELKNLKRKIIFIREFEGKKPRSFEDATEIMNSLIKHVSYRINDFLLSKIHELRKTLTNYQYLQEILMEQRDLYEFVYYYKKDTAIKILEEYGQTMKCIYFSYFKAYNKALFDLICVNNRSHSKVLLATVKERRKVASHPTTAHISLFALDKRDHVLDDLSHQVIVPYIDHNNKKSHNYEVLIRSEQHVLLANYGREFTFLNDFFLLRDNELISFLHENIMESTLKYLTKSMTSNISSSYDLVGMLLCSQVVNKLKQSADDDKLYSLDGYWLMIYQMFWERFIHLFNLNVDSLRNFDMRNSNILECSPNSPFFVVRRCAELLSSLTSINNRGFSQTLCIYVDLLWSLTDSFIQRISTQFTKKIDKLCITINNYDVIHSVLSSHVTESDVLYTCRDKLRSLSEEFCKEILEKYFSDLISFVRLYDGVEIAETERTNLNCALGRVVRHFNGHWESSVERVCSEVTHSFSNFVNGSNMLKETLVLLVDYYRRFYDMAGKYGSCDNLISVHNVIVKIKRYKNNI